MTKHESRKQPRGRIEGEYSEWKLSEHDGCIWMSGGTIETAHDIVRKARELDQKGSFQFEDMGVIAYHTGARSYYVIHNKVTKSKHDEIIKNMQKWAKNDTEPAYYTSIGNDDVRIMRAGSHVVECLQDIANALAPAPIVLSLFLLPAIMFEHDITPGVGIALSVLFAIFVLLQTCGTFLSSINVTARYTPSREGMIVTLKGFNDWSRLARWHVKRIIRKYYGVKKIITDNTGELVVLTSVPCTNVNYTLGEAVTHGSVPYDTVLDLMDSYVMNPIIKEPVDTKDNVVNEIKTGMKVSDNAEMAKKYITRAQELVNRIIGLEAKVLNDNKISAAFSSKLHTIEDNPGLYDAKQYEDFIGQLEESVSALEKLQSNDSTINDAMKDINAVIEFKSRSK